MEQLRYEIILEAESPIAHSAGTLGNASVAMTRKIRRPDGSFVSVPIVTADTLRHKLREAVTYALLDAAGLLADGGPQLSAAALRLLFNGGMLTGRGDASSVKLDEFRRMMTALPSLALFGGCANNHLIPGQLAVGDALLLCEESKHRAPAWTLAWCAKHGIALDTHRRHLDEELRVRMDATLIPEKRRLLSAEARDGVERRLVASERAHDEDDAPAREATKSAMLPRTTEVIVPGSLFTWDVTATLYSALDRDTFDTAVAAFLANARVGGKAGTGHGRVRALAANMVPLARPSEKSAALDLAGLGSHCGQVFRAHVAEHKDALKDLLRTVDA
jgi:hypothetical protein